ncbi:RMtype1_S_EcoKI-TRD2-CR2_like domain containing protein [Caulobacteraceae bacterium]
MNADLLLAHYEQIADAPDAILRLRRFVLDLAVRGKLVPQDPNDEPVAKRYLINGVASSLPANWGVLNFGKFCDIEGGNQPPKSQFISEPRDGYVQLFQIRDLGDRGIPTYIPISSARSLSKEGDILIGRYGASVGKIFWAQNGAYNVAMAKFIWPHDAFVSSFAFLLLKSDILQAPLARATRSAQAGFNKGDLARIDFPLPPLAEQHRIVAKVDELMALCDQLEAARTEREASRDRLAAASLARLNAPAPETFEEDARFALDALPALTTRPDQIKALRQTILNLAVRGKLVPQDPNDEPACLEAAICDRPPKDIPATWLYTRLSNLLAEDTRNGYSRKPDEAPDGIPILRISAGTVRRDGVVAEEEHKLISGISEEARIQYGLQPGDLLACRFNGNKAFVGRFTIFKDYLGLQPIYPDKLIRVRVSATLSTPKFLRLAGDTDLVRTDIEAACATTVGNWGISASNLKDVRFPLPPLAEQHRIVAKVDELMALCDQLEASLTNATSTRTLLLNALLAEALTSVEALELEAVE